MAQLEAAETHTPLSDPNHLPTIWATELASIEVRGPVALLTFCEVLRLGATDEERRICARVAIEAGQLQGISRRIEKLLLQAASINDPVGTA